jgi:hypothetical protein
MALYRKRPVIVEAVCWTGRNYDEIKAFMAGHEWERDAFDHIVIPTLEGHIVIPTLEGRMMASPGDWIIRGTQGELYPCKPAIFAQLYESLEPVLKAT